MNVTNSELLDNTKLSENKIKESEHRLNTAQRVAKIGSWEFEVESQQLIWSNEMYRIFEIENHPDINLLESYSKKIKPEDVSRIMGCFNLALTQGLPYELEHSIQSINNTEKDIYCTAEIFKNDLGHVVKIYGTSQDITERKKNEKQIQKIVNELTLKNNDLMQFNYIVSHNLRAPIVNIIGLANLMNTENMKTGEIEEIVSLIKDSAKNMDVLICDLSAVLGVRSSLNTKREKLDVLALINRIADTLEKEIKDSACVLSVDIEKDVESIFNVKAYVESIFYNLMSNAIKYKSTSRIPEISIVVKKDNEEVLIKVVDNGLGIDMDKHSKQLFGLYKRFNLDVDGKGLGLHMTKNQVESLGGRISVESSPGNGAAFSIYLPMNSIN